MQTEQINVLEGNLVPLAVGRILPGAAFGLADPDPVGGLVTRAGEAIPLDKRLHSFEAVTLFVPPVRADPPQDQAQNVTGQARHLHPGHHQESCIVG